MSKSSFLSQIDRLERIVAKNIELQTPNSGEDHPSSVLTEGKVMQIRTAYDRGDKSQGQLAKEYGVSKVTIKKIVHRKSWRHV